MLERIGLIANLGKSAVEDALRRCGEELTARGLTPVYAQELTQTLGLKGASVPETELVGQVDAIISLGGDGTFLKASRLVGKSGVPLLGINLGSLGFLAEVRLEEIPDAMRALAEGDYILEKRKKVAARVHRNGDKVFETTALNDAVLNMGPMPRVLDLQVVIAGTPVGRYLADGLIVATPTGSTAYSLSAGGPIVDPSMDALVLTPICPHTLGVRPMILEQNHPIEVVMKAGPDGVLSADGQVATDVRKGDRISFRRAHHPAYFIRLPRRDFFEIIQEKLNWGGPARGFMPGDGPEDEPSGPAGTGDGGTRVP